MNKFTEEHNLLRRGLENRIASLEADLQYEAGVLLEAEAHVRNAKNRILVVANERDILANALEAMLE